MSRSNWKPPFSQLRNKAYPFLQILAAEPLISQGNARKNGSRFHSQKQKLEKTIMVWFRNSTILPEHIGTDVKIYNGKNWFFRKIIEEMVGHKFGEFCPTKKKQFIK